MAAHQGVRCGTATTVSTFEGEITRVKQPQIGQATGRFYSPVVGGAAVAVDVRFAATNCNTVRRSPRNATGAVEEPAEQMRQSCANAGVNFALDDIGWLGADVYIGQIEGGRAQARSVAVAIAAARAIYEAFSREAPEDLPARIRALDFGTYRPIA